MIIINLPTGKTLSVSTNEYLFKLKEEDIDEFYQSCIADDLGIFVENPFALKTLQGYIEIEEE